MATTLADLRARARQRADMEASLFVSVAELDTYINTAMLELYDLMILAYEDYYISSTTYTIANDERISLPANFYKLKGFEYQLGGEFFTLQPYRWNERNRRNNIHKLYNRSYLDRAYRIMGTELFIEPRSASAGTYQLWFVPSLDRLVSSTDELETQMQLFGWEEYIVIDAARKMLMKEESYTQHLDMEKKILIGRLQTIAADRDIDEPEQVRDVQDELDIW